LQSFQSSSSISFHVEGQVSHNSHLQTIQSLKK
jgi:hypothetical protein